jgi:hypothetical protein
MAFSCWQQPIITIYSAIIIDMILTLYIVIINRKMCFGHFDI